MKRFDFESLGVYQAALRFAKDVYHLSERFPEQERFGLTSQLRRAAVSISANIAEGHRRSKKEAIRYYEIARGSACECIPLLTIALEIDLIDLADLEKLKDQCVAIDRMLTGLAKSLRISPPSLVSPVSLVSRGFTLVELLIVVTILGILVAAVVPRLAGRTEQARVGRAGADVKGNIALALDLFELDAGKYPTAEQGLAALRAAPADVENWRGPYLKQEPMDPWGHPYRYRYPGSRNPKDYDLFSLGPDGVEGTADDIGNWSGEKSK